MMRSASRQALVALRSAQESATGSRTTAAAYTELADELYAVAQLLVDQPRLRRLLGDPATEPQSRSALVGQLLGNRIGKPALQVVSAAVEQRWSSPWDLSDAIEGAGDDALFASAERARDLDRVEDELFRLERIVQGDGELLGLLDETAMEPARRQRLLDDLIGEKVAAATRHLLDHAVASTRKRSILLAIDDLLQRAAARQERSIARVVSAAPLTDAQVERLGSALTALYGRPMSVRTALDPALRGGVVVRVGDEVIDGSVAARFDEARTALVH